ncbi:hypothetical protein JRQ81_008923 [Phrynocephalus forsythii]|uniref:TGF-beta family profile domain-containing protein n=1 Tax=Phrynocephalus forsythii TaxID=171643 RepID=A0A9Q0XB36_9SAUR|nr:hypothetical protein JRQ81_008923 [Phrynocephalus forsythii]
MAILRVLLPLQIAWAFSLAGAHDLLGSREARLLRALGLPARTPASPKSGPDPPPVPPLLWKLFGRGNRTEDPEPCWIEELRVPGNLVRVFRDQGAWMSPPEPDRWLCLQKRLYFNLSALGEGERLTLARLEIRFGRNLYGASSPGGPFELSLYRPSGLALRGLTAHPYSRRLLVGQSFAHLHKSFAFDLTEVAKEWRAPARNLGLLLEIAAPAATAEGPACAGIDSFLEASLLAVSLAPAPCRRGRQRRGLHHVPPAGGHVCKARRLYLSFGDVGWENWIIAPQGYMANYCVGECPFPLTEELNSTNHAILQTIVHSLDPDGTPQPCCVPVRLSPVSILYYDNDDNVVLRHYEDMVVDECGCR